MESNCPEESINSSEEIDQESIDLGVGRSYNCVFCKRGFNTAQALGGHMNIHRKDRTRNKTNSNKLQEHQYSTGPRLYQQIIPTPPSDQSAPNNHHFVPLDQSQTFAYSSGMGSLYGSYGYQHLQFLPVDSNRDDDLRSSDPLVPEDWSSLSLRFGEDSETNNRLQDLNYQKEEVDLELRLGYG